ncbi:MAG: protein kinase domain-containing protein [Acidobacteriota bacterium]
MYRAVDTRLGRTVAVKVLPSFWANHPDMQQRFEREAQALASLSHPHICVLHDVGREQPAGGDTAVDFLVMEFLEGETLAARLERGALGVSEALKLAVQIADALDKAHRRGVVHRDLKPSNVMLTPGGAKLLDFGLAKTGAASGGVVSAISGVSVRPTRADLTTPGAMIGTLQYMAPEQLDGSDADARTDIFAFGVLLHEMVTGKRAFGGKTQVLVISAIATSHPEPLSKIDPATPAALEHVVRTCLAKDPDDRWQTARDLLAELEWIAEGGDATTPAAAAAPRTGDWRLWLTRGALAAAVLLAAALAVPALLALRRDDAPAETRFRVPIQLTADVGTAGGRGGGTGGQGTRGVSGPAVFDASHFALSPDGRVMAFVARQSQGDTFVMFVRPIGGVTPQRLAGTENAAQPFWSADSRWIGFVSGGRVKRIEATGGPPQDICEAGAFFGGTWNTDGTILFGAAQGVMRVAAEGGKPEAATTLDASESGHYWPHFLPDGRRFLYTAWSAQAPDRAIVVGRLDSNEKTHVVAAPSNAGYSETGHVVFHRDSAVYAQRFDARTLSVSGEPFRVADEVTFDSGNGRGDFRVSRTGVLAYFYSSGGGVALGPSGPTADLSEWRWAWVSRGGQVLESLGPPGAYRGVNVSPDARRIAAHRHDANGGDIYVIEPRGTQTRLTMDASRHSSMPVWSPDGSRIVYASLRGGKWGLYQTLSSGSGTEEPLFESEAPKAPMSWSPDGKRIVFWTEDPKTGSDLWVLTVDDEKAAPLLATPFTETHAQISPDGKWIAYADNSKDDRLEIYVKPFPTGSGGWQVSTSGGDWPRWRADGKELFYHAPVTTAGSGLPYAYGGPVYSVAVNTSGSIFEPDPPRPLMTVAAVNVAHSGGDYFPYAVSPDGQRFLILQFVTPTTVAGGQLGPDMYSALTVALNAFGPRGGAAR